MRVDGTPAGRTGILDRYRLDAASHLWSVATRTGWDGLDATARTVRRSLAELRRSVSRLSEGGRLLDQLADNARELVVGVRSRGVASLWDNARRVRAALHGQATRTLRTLDAQRTRLFSAVDQQAADLAHVVVNYLEVTSRSETADLRRQVGTLERRLEAVPRRAVVETVAARVVALERDETAREGIARLQRQIAELPLGELRTALETVAARVGRLERDETAREGIARLEQQIFELPLSELGTALATVVTRVAALEGDETSREGLAKLERQIRGLPLVELNAALEQFKTGNGSTRPNQLEAVELPAEGPKLAQIAKDVFGSSS